jgi:hypothetical protein
MGYMTLKTVFDVSALRHSNVVLFDECKSGDCKNTMLAARRIDTAV